MHSALGVVLDEHSRESSAGTADVDQVSWHFCTGTPMRNPVCLQATRRALIHRQPSHRGKLGKKPDGLGKKAVSIKAELTFSQKRNREFNKEWYWQKLEPVPGVSRKVEAMLGEKRKSQVQETDWGVIIYQNQLPVSANSFQYPACCHFLHVHLQFCSFPSILKKKNFKKWQKKSPPRHVWLYKP